MPKAFTGERPIDALFTQYKQNKPNKNIIDNIFNVIVKVNTRPQIPLSELR